MKNKINELKYYSLYNYKSVLEAIVSNFSHSSMITSCPLFASNNFSISVIKRICIRSFHQEVKIHTLLFRCRRSLQR